MGRDKLGDVPKIINYAAQASLKLHDLSSSVSRVLGL
jgi:hypothetical protein